MRLKKRKIFAALTALAMTALSASALPTVTTTVTAENPIVQTSFTPDPAPVVFGDELYVYTGCDRDGQNDFYKMTGWQCFSTKDMKNWTDHGKFLKDNDFSWCNENDAWASQCIKRGDKYYFYFTTTNKSGGGRAIGVGVADKPEGPYKDVLGKPLCGPNWDYIDPTVIIDDDGQAWLMFGNPKCYYVKLKEDMVTLDGQIKQFDMNNQQFGPGSGERSCTYGEGPWIYKHNNLYYLVWASFVDGFGGESQCYATGPSVTGPWTYRGVIQEGSNCFTTHGGIIDYKDHSYFFYHKNGLQGGGAYNRSASCDEFTYNADGTINKPKLTNEGPTQLEPLDPFVRNEAETICWSSGIKTEACSEGGVNIGNIENGDYIKVAGVDFGNGADKFVASVASNTDGGVIEIHTDKVDGPIVGALKVSGTGGWQKWKELETDVKVSGKHDIYFKYTGGSGYLLNVDWWKFENSSRSNITPTEATTVKAEPATKATTKAQDTVAAETQTAAKAQNATSFIFRDTFESGVGDWEGRGDGRVSATKNASIEGEQALFVSGRTSDWHGARVKLGSNFAAGKEYSFSANVMYDRGSNKEETFKLNIEYTDPDGNGQYPNIAEAKVEKGKWLQLSNTNFKIPTDATGDVYLYLETADSTTSFYIDDVAAAEAGKRIVGLSKGDLNYDGVINVIDFLMSKRGLLKSTINEKDKALFLAADVDNSGKFELNDLVALSQFITQKVTKFEDNTPEPTEPPTEPKPEFNYNANLQYKAAPDSYFRKPANAGKVVKENYNSINGNKNMYVYLPYGYDESKKYNVFYLMHGGGESEETCFNDNNIDIDTMLDNMIANGDIEPMIVVTPTFNKAPSADGVWEEMRKSIIPYVESKYSTYADKDTSLEGLKASRYHRAYGGFSMGGGSTWANFNHNLDIIAYFMPLSGHCWDGAGAVCNAAKNSGFAKDEYFVLAATGTEDLAYGNMVPMINELKTRTDVFTYTSDFSKGNLYFLEARGNVHWWPQVRHYIYDALPYFFHEHQ